MFWQYRAQPQFGDSSRLKVCSLITVCILLLTVFYLAIAERFARTQQVKGVGKHHTLAKGNHVVNYTGKKVFSPVLCCLSHTPVTGTHTEEVENSADFFLYLFIDFFTSIFFAYALAFWECASYGASLPQMLSENEFESHMHKHMKKVNLFGYS